MTNKERGLRTRAGKLLTSFIRQIAEEQTEMVTDPRTGEDKMASKAEALVRLIWKRALGYTEQKIVKGKLVDVYHHPDNYSMGLIFDRLEGKAPLSVGENDNKLTVSERISELGKKRIAQAGDLDAD